MPPDALLSLAFATLAAALAPLIAAGLPRQAVPVIVVEILLGIVAGPSGLGWVTPNAALDLLALLGFAALMFVSGLELDPALLMRPGAPVGGPRLGRRVVGMVLGTLAISLAGAWALWGGQRPAAELIFLALLLSTTSMGTVLPTLKEHALTTGAYGQMLLACAVLAGLVAMLGLSMVGAWIAGGSPVRGLLPLVFALALIGVGVLLPRLRRAAVWLALRDRLAPLDTPTLRWPLRAAFALLFGLALVAQALGTALGLAAFAAGLAVGALSARGSALRERVESAGFGLLIPMFFFAVGVGFDLRALLDSPRTLALLPALLAIAYLNKLLPLLALRRHYDWPQLLGGGLLLGARLSLIVAAAALGRRLGVLDAAFESAVILLALLTTLVSPMLFRLLVPLPAPGAAR